MFPHSDSKEKVSEYGHKRSIFHISRKMKLKKGSFLQQKKILLSKIID